MSSIKDKVILITGATSGFGRSLAVATSLLGAKVIAAGRRAKRLDELKKQFPTIHTICLDIRDEEAVSSVLENIPREFSAVDILVNNAGLALGVENFENKPSADNHQMIDTNIKGLIFITQALLPQMIARNSGHIVNISSVAANYPYPGGNVYGACKAFVSQFSLNLRADLLGKNIRVTSIEPGMCDTEFSLIRFNGDKQKAENVYQGMKPLSAEDIANAIIWCISQPEHVNVNRMEIMPVMQAFSPFAVSRNTI